MGEELLGTGQSVAILWVAVFWASVALVAYTYGGYLFLLVGLDAVAGLRSNARFLAGHGERRRPLPADGLPRVSVLIAAHDEESVICEKIENTLALEYPGDRLEILVGSDGSTDGTDDIVASFADRGVKLSRAARAGKASVLNRLAREATGDVWLFTDANTFVDPGALRLMVRRLSDPSVGGVCGRLRLVSPNGKAAQEGLYWRYENLLKFYESKRGALMGANGGLYLLRREAWRSLPPDTIVDDFLATMRVLLEGKQLVYEAGAWAQEETAGDLKGEFRRRVRIAAGNFQSLRTLAPLLWRRSFATFAFWSHKLLRWLAPLLLVAAFVANLALARHPVYGALFGLQVSFYLAALAGRARLPASVARWTSLPRYFVEMNLALLLGLLRHLRGSQAAVWQRTARLPVRKQA